MKVLELFAGSCSIGKAATELGMEVFSSDVRSFERLKKEDDTEDIHYKVDIFDFDPSKVPFKPDIIWASPPCTAFSVASCWLHWNIDPNDPEKRVPATKKALHGIAMVKKTLQIIAHFKPKYWFIENPRGMLRKQDFMNDAVHMLDGKRYTVTYCQYGDYRMKPTDIWTNLNSINPQAWQPRAMCKRGQTCHDASPRGSQKGGVMRQSNSYERSRIPKQLCLEVLKACQDNQTSALS
ncbi:MAG TPA: DNA methyltransferase [Flavobacteriales bacterium]|nr:DNA methyltransferase [Flavobacteriales bacterium]